MKGVARQTIILHAMIRLDCTDDTDDPYLFQLTCKVQSLKLELCKSVEIGTGSSVPSVYSINFLIDNKFKVHL